MTTRAGLRTVIRNQGIDSSTWSDAEVNQWIADAIAEYSIHFPRWRESTGNACAEGEREYDLPSDFAAALQVEYPEGNEPLTTLTRLPEDDPRFGPGYYDVRAGAALVLGESPSAGQTYGLLYQAHHDYPDADDDVLTVPDEDLEVLILFVVLKAYRRLELDEAVNPDGSTVILSMLGTNAGRARQQYEAALRGRVRPGGTGMVSWGESR